MIRNSLIVCIAVVLAWHLVMPRLPRDYYAIPGQQRANYLHAQKFVHDTAGDARVIVGSSMADRLDERALGEDHVKLTFPGGGPLTGLELIRGTGRKPPLVWIETNVILRDAEQDLLDDALSPWRRALRERSPVFGERGRPSEFGIGFLKAAVSKLTKIGGSKKGAREGQAALESGVFEDVMKDNRIHLDRTPDPKVLAERVRLIGGMVDQLEQDGTRCVFFEMPFDASLVNLAEPTAIREAMTKRFPKEKYLWLDLKRGEPWRTTDGIHLQADEADQVVERILEFENSLK